MGIAQHCLNSVPENGGREGEFEYVFGEDNFEKDVEHQGAIGSRCK